IYYSPVFISSRYNELFGWSSFILVVAVSSTGQMLTIQKLETKVYARGMEQKEKYLRVTQQHVMKVLTALP
ncbi:hypothetical protein Ocin01_19847, partial [Orchesella cincta]